ncbi:MAG: hypothetical protein AB7F22_15380 [Reyranella sp.]|uniref:hypothetical protein n=1 Tax=Reyranella sp. TaxID=1929291 RepID=UPI003D13561F
MTLRWRINHDRQRVLVIAEGDVTRADIDAYLDAVASEGALAYPKVFDGSAGDTSMDAHELLGIAVRIRSYHDRPVGPLAIVLREDKSHLVLRVLGALAAARRPLKIFSSLKPAERWIDSLEYSR